MMMMIWWLIIAGIAYWGYSYYKPRRTRTYSYNRIALEDAQIRHDRGEITSEEYEEIRKKLVEQ